MVGAPAPCRSAALMLMPCSRSRVTRAAMASSSVTSMPPSPVVRILRGWNEKTPLRAAAATGRSLYVEPIAHAASSITTMSADAHTLAMASTSAGMPPWCTTITARVLGVMTAATDSGVRFWVTTSTSAKTGVAPTYRAAFAVAMNESDGTMTSSPAPTPSTRRARCRPAVHDDSATARRHPTWAANAASNSATRGPWAIHPEAIASAAACCSARPRKGFMMGIIVIGT